MRLAYIGSIKDDILNMEELALNADRISCGTQYPGAVLAKRYRIQEEGTSPGPDIGSTRAAPEAV